MIFQEKNTKMQSSGTRCPTPPYKGQKMMLVNEPFSLDVAAPSLMGVQKITDMNHVSSLYFPPAFWLLKLVLCRAFSLVLSTCVRLSHLFTWIILIHTNTPV